MLRKRSLKRLVTLVSVLAFLVSVVSYVTVTASESREFKEKLIVGYYPEWGVYAAHDMYEPKHIPWEKITHINYAFAKTSGGKIAVFDEWAALQMAFGEPYNSPYKGTFGQFKKIKANYPEVKVLISVGGWTLSHDFHDISLTDASRATFADSCVEFCRSYGFDGIDIDWEYPNYNRPADKQDNPNDTGCVGGPEDKHNYTLLLQKLREKLDAAGKADGKYYPLTIAAPAGYDKIIWTEPELYHKYLDFLNLMTYDFHGAWDQYTGNQSPLYASPDEPQWYDNAPDVRTKYNTDWAVQEYIKIGVPKDKITMGVPYYSRGWRGVEPGNNPQLPGLFAKHLGGAAGKWDGGVPAGVNAFYHLKAMEGDSKFVKYRDVKSGNVPYLYSASLKEMYSYEDEISLNTKIDYMWKNDLGGIMFWEFTGDYPSKGGTTLTDIIHTRLHEQLPSPTPEPGHRVAGSIHPDLVYGETAAPVIKAGFNIEVVGTGLSAVSDENGNFEIRMVPENTSATIKISKPGYMTREIKNVALTKSVLLGTSAAPLTMWPGDMPIEGVQDNAINMSDVVELVRYFNSAAGDGKYVELFDLNKDGAINMADILVIINHFNTSSASYGSISLAEPTATPKPTPRPTNTPKPTPTPTPVPPAWAVGVDYKAGQYVLFNNAVYRCIYDHKSITGWDPVSVPAIWEKQQ
ncbi:MAG: glycosyl hydrolase family 18 protein [Clostridia bacterium]|nr:glycosyl hydrolase family 18 protein [Clostridia bacterium]